MPESEYLANQSEQAHRGIKSGFSDLEKNLARAAQACINDHPFLTLAAAVAAGFVATEMMPSKTRVTKAAPSGKQPPNTSPMADFLKETAKGVLLPALIAVLESAGTRAAAQEPEESTNA